MAQKITLTSGSVFAGNPITLAIQPNTLTSKPSFHRVIVEVYFDDGTGSYETNKLTIPVTTEKREVSLDISSALRISLDSYKYTATPSTYPVVSWYVKAYDEYMDSNGEVHTNAGEVYYPADGSKDSTKNLRCIAGAFSDIERLKAGATKSVTFLSCKPTDTHELAVVGESFVYPVSYSAAQNLLDSATLEAPSSEEEEITQEGAQSIHWHPIYALPASEAEDRTTFRFINRFGCLESISVPKSYSQKMNVETTEYTKAIQETFNEFSRSVVDKKNDKEGWLFQSDPLTEKWLRWYYHEFLMSKHVWLRVSGIWLPCTIAMEDEITIKDNTNKVMHSVSFTVKLGINGNPCPY